MRRTSYSPIVDTCIYCKLSIEYHLKSGNWIKTDLPNTKVCTGKTGRHKPAGYDNTQIPGGGLTDTQIGEIRARYIRHIYAFQQTVAVEFGVTPILIKKTLGLTQETSRPGGKGREPVTPKADTKSSRRRPLSLAAEEDEHEDSQAATSKKRT